MPLAATELTRILFYQFVRKAQSTLAQQLWLLVLKCWWCKILGGVKETQHKGTCEKLQLSKRYGGGHSIANECISKGRAALRSQWEQRMAAKRVVRFAQVANVSLQFRWLCGSLPVWLGSVPVVSPAWLEPFPLYPLVKRSGHHHPASSAWRACAVTHVGISAKKVFVQIRLRVFHLELRICATENQTSITTRQYISKPFAFFILR